MQIKHSSRLRRPRVLLLIPVLLAIACGSSSTAVVTEEDREAALLVVEWNLYYAEAEDMSGYMGTLHENSPGRSTTRDLMQTAFDDFDLSYEIVASEIVSISGDSAQVSVVQITRKKGGSLPFRNNRLTAIHNLRRDAEGRWKIYSSDISDVEYLN